MITALPLQQVRWALGVALFALTVAASACAGKAPPSLSPDGVRVWQANEVAVAIGSVQHAAIELNDAQICDRGGCRPILSEANTRAVVQNATSGLKALRAVPAGWKETGLTTIREIQSRLDDAGRTKLKSYLDAALAVINEL